jgi:hypothetical protein
VAKGVPTGQVWTTEALLALLAHHAGRGPAPRPRQAGRRRRNGAPMRALIAERP